MAENSKLLSTDEFASKAGSTPSKVSRLIREGKIKAEKVSGKWMIHPNQIKIEAVQELSKPAKSSTKPKTVKSSQKKAAAAGKKSTLQKKKGTTAEKKPAASKSYSLAQFVDMTYLTEYGVMDWLKKGRLTGKQNAAGEWLVDAANLDVPGIQRLVR